MVNLISNKKHNVIKRSGEIEPYSEEKLYRVILWACEGSTAFADKLVDAISIKIYDKIKIEKLYDEVIATASNLISDIYPRWEQVAKNLYLLKLHKEIGVKRTEYPYYSDILISNVKVGMYQKEFGTVEGMDSYLGLGAYKRLTNVLNPEYDKLFTFGGLNLFVQKYCNTHKGKLLELPQHVYMRVAIQLMKSTGIRAIIAKYHQLASHSVTEATPKMVNSLKPNSQLMSCCLLRPTDSLESINVVSDLSGRESKFAGGLSTDMSVVRAKGAPVAGNKGRSGGVVPFVQAYEASISAYDQGGSRGAASCVYFSFFHYESPEICILKEESGKAEDRARRLQYAIKWNSTFTDAIKTDSEIYLIDPHKTQDLTYSYGDEFKRLYAKYSKSTAVRKRKYKARDLAILIAKMKLETGSMYTFFTDNANIQNIGCGTITQANLCTEFLPNFEAIVHTQDALVNNSMVREYTGDIALCNLSSVNLMKWVVLSDKEKEVFMELLVKGMNNAIDDNFYPNALGEKHSKQHRNVGIGVTNYANLLASNKLLWDDLEARELTHKVFEELQFYAIKSSIQLAKETSRFPLFKESKWAEGIFPHELSILGKTTNILNYPLQMDWESLRPDLLKYGIANEYLMAIAPTTTNAKGINATEGIDPIRKLKTIQEGTYSLPFIVPNLKENRQYYQTTFKISNKDTIELAAIRQKFLCMSQPISLVYPNPDSAYDVIKDIMYAEELGLKTIYYTHSDTAENTEPVCENCSS